MPSNVSDAWSWSRCVYELTGGTVRVDGDQLVVTGNVHDEARTFITRNKPAIMEELRGQNPVA